MRFSTIPLTIKLPALIVGGGLIMSAIVGTVGYIKLDALASEDVASTVQSVLVERTTAVKNFYGGVDRDLREMADGPTALTAFRRLQLGWSSAGMDPSVALVDAYVTNNPNPPDQRMKYDRADGTFAYNQQHFEFHPTLRKWVDVHQFNDAYLVDLDGNVIYTVDKAADFASNLKTGAYKDGPLAMSYKAALTDPGKTVHFSDFSKYGPAAGKPAAFAATPIRNEKGEVIGVLAIQLSETMLMSIVGDANSLGELGELTLVGPDHMARSNSRFDGHFKLLDPLPDLPQLDVNDTTRRKVLSHIPLMSGEIGTALTDEVALPGLDYSILVEIPDRQTYVNVYAARNELLMWIAAAAAAMAVAGVVLSKTITKPLSRVTDTIMAIANGDLTSEIADAERQDELGDISKSLEALRQKLDAAAGVERDRNSAAAAQKVVVEALSVGLRDLSAGNLTAMIETVFDGEYETLRQNYNQAVAKLNETIAMVVDTAESIRSRSREISQSSEDLSARTETQAATLEETATALDELTASIRSAANGAKEVENIVRSARSEAEESGVVVQGAVAAMTEIEKSSDQISQIIGVIDDIAFQTNLLALNAGVEAARAGDAGKGFAVVASEVRALAQRSSAAAKEIKVLISASTQHVESGVERVGKAGEALSNIVIRVSHISSLVSNIATAAAEQATGLGEINLGVNQLDQVTQQNAAMVVGSTAASQSLNQEAAGLAELVAQFSIRRAGVGRGQLVNLPAVRSAAARPAASSPPPQKTHIFDDPQMTTQAVGNMGKWQDF